MFIKETISENIICKVLDINSLVVKNKSGKCIDHMSNIFKFLYKLSVRIDNKRFSIREFQTILIILGQTEIRFQHLLTN